MNDVGAVIDFVRIVGTQLSVVQIEYLIGENAEISFSMNINLTGTPPTEEEMRAPATIKPENATPNIPKPQEPAKEKPDQKKPKPEKKPAKKKEKQSEDSMQLSLEGWF